MMENCVYSILKKTNKTQINYHSYSLISDVHTYIILKNLVGHIPSKKYRKTNLYQKNKSLVNYFPRCLKTKNVILDINSHMTSWLESQFLFILEERNLLEF